VQPQDTGLRALARPRATLRDIAQRAGVSYSFVIKVARGERRPNQAIRRAVEELYNVPARSVFGEEFTGSQVKP
jgi:transcriptional regulator with XRE-family HTH domain